MSVVAKMQFQAKTLYTCLKHPSFRLRTTTPDHGTDCDVSRHAPQGAHPVHFDPGVQHVDMSPPHRQQPETVRIQSLLLSGTCPLCVSLLIRSTWPRTQMKRQQNERERDRLVVIVVNIFHPNCLLRSHFVCTRFPPRANS